MDDEDEEEVPAAPTPVSDKPKSSTAKANEMSLDDLMKEMNSL